MVDFLPSQVISLVGLLTTCTFFANKYLWGNLRMRQIGAKLLVLFYVY